MRECLRILKFRILSQLLDCPTFFVCRCLKADRLIWSDIILDKWYIYVHNLKKKPTNVWSTVLSQFWNFILFQILKILDVK